MRCQFKPYVEYIELAALNDDFGDLNAQYTKDGLHFQKRGI